MCYHKGMMRMGSISLLIAFKQVPYTEFVGRI
jgi:hypothetical protein